MLSIKKSLESQRSELATSFWPFILLLVDIQPKSFWTRQVQRHKFLIPIRLSSLFWWRQIKKKGQKEKTQPIFHWFSIKLSVISSSGTRWKKKENRGLSGFCALCFDVNIFFSSFIRCFIICHYAQFLIGFYESKEIISIPVHEEEFSAYLTSENWFSAKFTPQKKVPQKENLQLWAWHSALTAATIQTRMCQQHRGLSKVLVRKSFWFICVCLRERFQRKSENCESEKLRK